jgi:hypothetical protein
MSQAADEGERDEVAAIVDWVSEGLPPAREAELFARERRGADGSRGVLRGELERAAAAVTLATLAADPIAAEPLPASLAERLHAEIDGRLAEQRRAERRVAGGATTTGGASTAIVDADETPANDGAGSDARRGAVLRWSGWLVAAAIGALWIARGPSRGASESASNARAAAAGAATTWTCSSQESPTPAASIEGPDATGRMRLVLPSPAPSASTTRVLDCTPAR